MLTRFTISRYSSTFHSTSLVVLLDARGSHAVDNRVTSGIHVADSHADGQQREEHDHAEPQDDVEHHRVVLLVGLGQVDVVLKGKQKINSVVKINNLTGHSIDLSNYHLGLLGSSGRSVTTLAVAVLGG